VSWRVRFSPTNDPYLRYMIVCCDKDWGSPGCQAWTGDCVQVGYGGEISCCSSNTKKITAVTSSDAGYYYSVEIYDPNGRLVKSCNNVDRRNPCVYEGGISPGPSPSLPSYLLLIFVAAAVAIALVVLALRARKR